jgi:hypothetical protein
MPQRIERIIKNTSRQPKTGGLCLYVRERTYKGLFLELSFGSGGFALNPRRLEELPGAHKLWR